MVINLLPCPFCGAEAHLSGCFPDGHYQVKCNECQAIVKADRDDKAHGMWNQRAIHHPIAFGRWILKYATPTIDPTDCALVWRFEGINYDTDELYKVFCKRFI